MAGPVVVTAGRWDWRWALGPLSFCAVKRVLITGMSGVGKTSLLHELAARGYRTVDTDYGDYYETVDGEMLWRENRIDALLSSYSDKHPSVLFVQGTTRN